MESYKILANTSEADAELIDFALTKGVITNLFIHFPPGCHSLARCQFLQGAHQIFPHSTGNYFADDGYTLPLREFYILSDSPTSLKWKVWNVDDTYDHTLRVTIVVLPVEVVIPLYGLKEVFATLKRQQDILYGVLTGKPMPEEGEE